MSNNTLCVCSRWRLSLTLQLLQIKHSCVWGPFVNHWHHWSMTLSTRFKICVINFKCITLHGEIQSKLINNKMTQYKMKQLNIQGAWRKLKLMIWSDISFVSISKAFTTFTLPVRYKVGPWWQSSLKCSKFK